MCFLNSVNLMVHSLRKRKKKTNITKVKLVYSCQEVLELVEIQNSKIKLKSFKKYKCGVLIFFFFLCLYCWNNVQNLNCLQSQTGLSYNKAIYC